jgi:hypothetical protein
MGFARGDLVLYRLCNSIWLHDGINDSMHLVNYYIIIKAARTKLVNSRLPCEF